jgi:hypothetical protein
MPLVLTKTLELEVLPNALAVCRFTPATPVPAWAFQGSFYSVSRTPEELSVVCDEALVPADVKTEKNWRCFKVKGPLAFGLTGILASLANPLAEAGISIFAVSTFDTDYLLVKQKDFDQATKALKLAGHKLKDKSHA